MYSRSSSGRSESFRIPEGYRGNAFAPLSPPVEQEAPIIDPTPIPDSEATQEESEAPRESLPAPLPAKEEAKPPSPLAALLPPKPTGVGGLLGDIGLEELLILGVILLLSQSETDDDILLFLILLLFYK